MDKHRKALELAGHAGCILLKNGAEIFRVQETMTRILCAYGVTDNNVYVISNGIFATEGEGTEHALSLVRHVPLGGVNLSRIDAVNAISREICEGRWTTDEAEALLIRAETLTPEKPLTHVFACALGAASFCYLFGGSLLDSAAAFPIGLLLQIYLFAAQKRRSGFMPYIWGSGLVTLLSGLLSALFPALSASWVVIGGIVPMVPGVTFTTSIREFFNGDYLSGVIHCICAMLTAVFIVTGIFPLVPGAGIYHTAYALVSRNMEAFTLRGMQTLALAGAIALGILIGMGFPKLLVELGGHALEKLPLCHREARP